MQGSPGEVLTTVVNVNHTPDYDVYIGRSSVFGNPYPIGRYSTREDVIGLYRLYFGRRLREDPDFRGAIERLRGKVLACHCKPAACHGDVIVEYLEGTAKNRKEERRG